MAVPVSQREEVTVRSLIPSVAAAGLALMPALALAPLTARADNRDVVVYQEAFTTPVLQPGPTRVIHDGALYAEPFAPTPAPGTTTSLPQSAVACARSCRCHGDGGPGGEGTPDVRLRRPGIDPGSDGGPSGPGVIIPGAADPNLPGGYPGSGGG